jgi:hypothetical protein
MVLHTEGLQKGLLVVKRFIFGMIAVAMLVGTRSVSTAALVVDYSPDTTGAPLGTPSYRNLIPGQQIGERFTLATSATITGGSIFSRSSAWSGMPVRFLIYADVAGSPAASPTVDLSPNLDAVDTVLTVTQPSLTRKHASVTPTSLAAGTYWFSMPGAGQDIEQAATNAAGYDDGGFAWCSYSPDPLLDRFLATSGDMYFTLDGSGGVIPEPSTLIIWSLLAGMGLGVGWWRQRKAA